MVDLTEPARLGGNFGLTGWKYWAGTRNCRSPGRSEAVNTCTDAYLQGESLLWGSDKNGKGRDWLRNMGAFNSLRSKPRRPLQADCTLLDASCFVGHRPPSL